MEISIPLNNVNPQYIYFSEKKNNVIVAGDFIKLIYSTHGFEMTGLYILFELNKRMFSSRIEPFKFSPLNLSSLHLSSPHLSSPHLSPSHLSPSHLSSSHLSSFHSFHSLQDRKDNNTLRHSLSTPDCTGYLRGPNLRSMDDAILTKHTLSFDPYLEHNYYIIQRLCNLEHDIIERYMIGKSRTKMVSYILKNQLLSGTIKYHSESRCRNVSRESGIEKIILKISGIWETNTNVGITMKFMILRD